MSISSQFSQHPPPRDILLDSQLYYYSTMEEEDGECSLGQDPGDTEMLLALSLYCLDRDTYIPFY